MEGAAYLPLLDQLRQTGVTCILVEMPFHMAIFDPDAALDVIPQFPEIRHWYIAGHSMGGAMASSLPPATRTRWTGSFCWEPISTATIRRRTPSPSMAPSTRAWRIKSTTPKTLWRSKAANHAQFGNYGPQKGDLPAGISAEEQQRQTVEAIQSFLADRSGT